MAQQMPTKVALTGQWGFALWELCSFPEPVLGLKTGSSPSPAVTSPSGTGLAVR